MAGKTGQKALAVTHPLIAHPERFSFYGAIHLLEKNSPGSVPVGHLGPASKECVRLRPSVSLSFPTADLEEADTVEINGSPITRLTTTFLGLYGVTSPIPAFYGEEILEDALDCPEGEEPATRAFLDIIHHRLLSLLYRCWEKYRYLYQKKRQGDDPLTRHLLCLVGIDPEAEEQSSREKADLRILALAGLITQQPRSAGGLEAFLKGLLGSVPLRVEQCTPAWMEIPLDQRTLLENRGASLGQDSVLGKKILSANHHFTLCIGPLTKKQFRELLPDRPGFSVVTDLTRFFLGLALEFTLELTLRQDQAGPLPLGQLGTGRLGWDAWLFSRPPEKDLSIKLKPSGQKECNLW